MTTINIRTDERIKEEATNLFAELGLTMSTAVNMFLRKAVKEKGIPFEVRFEVPNAETRAAFEETEKLLHDGKPGYKDTKSLWEALNV